MVKYDWRRALGVLSIVLLAALVMQSYYVAPERWGKMPATEYVADHVRDYEGKEIIVDGTATGVRTEGNGTVFFLNPLTKGLFSNLPVKTNETGIKEGLSGVNVHGTVRDGTLVANVIRVSPIPGYMESFFNFAGFFFFLFYSLREWKIKKRFPFIEEAS
jgi:hypothetical protein